MYSPMSCLLVYVAHTSELNYRLNLRLSLTHVACSGSGKLPLTFKLYLDCSTQRLLVDVAHIPCAVALL